jgi:hypothetical protein
MLAVSDHSLNLAQLALLDLLELLQARGYAFTTITPSSHRRVVERLGGEARDLRDFLGWSLPAREADIDPEVLALLRRGGALETDGERVHATVRVSTIADRLFLHSAWPTRGEAAVFLGPDSYRFVRFIDAMAPRARPLHRIVDIGAGAGVGGVFAAGFAPDARLELADLNPDALRLAAVNAAAARVRAVTVLCRDLDAVRPGFDLAVANPPFMSGSLQTYSNGGGHHGEGVSLAWARAALEKLAPGGRLLLYTGSAIADGGHDRLKSGLEGLCAERGAGLDYVEIDPDIFGQCLSMQAYEGIERIAAVGAVLVRHG